MEAAGVGPGDVRTVADLPKLPLLTREDARDDVAGRTATGGARVEIKKTTGGTTGQPLLFGYELDSEHWRQAVKLRGYGWAGYRLGRPTLHYWGAVTRPLPPPSTRTKVFVDRLLKREHYANCNLRAEEELLKVVQWIRRHRPHAILCYTQAGADLARFVVERGLRDWDDTPVLCCAERLFDADREQLTLAFGPKVFETYGCREVMLIGSECERHDGLHLSVENLIVEVVVEENGARRAARPGEVGAIVLTDLHNLAMPFIRYANGDLAAAADDAPCGCGRTLPRIGGVDGRQAETLRDGRGNRVGGLVFNLIFSTLAKAVRQFQAVQHQDGSITLKLVPIEGGLDDTTRAHVNRNLADYLPGVRVAIELVDDIPPSRSGKRQVVIVEK
jgi:phenylacetate-CoA ligase